MKTIKNIFFALLALTIVACNSKTESNDVQEYKPKELKKTQMVLMTSISHLHHLKAWRIIGYRPYQVKVGLSH